MVNGTAATFVRETTMLVPDRPRVGVWARELRFHPDRDEIADAAAELDDLGYRSIWIPDAGGNVFGAVDLLLEATSSLTVATGIVNIWMHDAEYVATETVRRWATHPGRFVLGLGASHASLVDSYTPNRYRRPWSTMRDYLAELDEATPSVPPEGRLLAALGPRMLQLAADRAAGAHPYLVTAEHTRDAREILGEGAVLVPELAIVLERDAARARERARAHVADYLTLPNYARNLLRLGFTEQDFHGGGSDRLVSALVAAGDEATIAARVAEHLDAGADHVCIQAVGPAGQPLPRATWRQLAPALLELGVRDDRAGA
jgi:probable F420-dependent oxidoreductase